MEKDMRKPHNTPVQNDEYFYRDQEMMRVEIENPTRSVCKKDEAKHTDEK